MRISARVLVEWSSRCGRGNERDDVRKCEEEQDAMACLMQEQCG